MNPNDAVGASGVQNQVVVSTTGPATAPVNQVEPNSTETEPKKPSKVTLILAIIFAVLAVGGIGFGIWAVLDGNVQKEQLQLQIANLDKQNSELKEELEKSSGGDDSEVLKNPVIKAKTSEEYHIRFESSLISVGEINIISVEIKDGNIESCELGKRTTNEVSYTTSKISNCNITGLDGGIFDVVEFGSGQDINLRRIGFIMTDGTVKYTLPFYDAIKSNDFGVKGSINIDGHVNNAVNISINDTVSGYGYSSTIFVLGDGSYVKFEDSMLK